MDLLIELEGKPVKNKPFDHPHPGARPPRKAPPPLSCDGGYIVERIINRQSESLCFEGFLSLDGLPCGLCAPLTLCGAEVVQIRPCLSGMAPCGCGHERLALTLLLTVVDSRGCRAETCATIEVESCARPMNCSQQGLNLRRGAEVCVGFAHFCPPCGFNVSLRILLQTIFSRSELTSPYPSCACACPPALPLYPPPIRRFG